MMQTFFKWIKLLWKTHFVNKSKVFRVRKSFQANAKALNFSVECNIFVRVWKRFCERLQSFLGSAKRCRGNAKVLCTNRIVSPGMRYICERTERFCEQMQSLSGNAMFLGENAEVLWTNTNFLRDCNTFVREHKAFVSECKYNAKVLRESKHKSIEI